MDLPARCAGASTAMLLAREGLDVLLVDRASFPSEIPHGHFIHRLGPRRLAEWGVLDAVFLAWPIAELARVRADIDGEFMAVLDGAPELAERVRAGRREERFGGATQLPNFLRRPFGPGWALVGDAGCHKDPFRALGIYDALRDAELVAAAVADGLAGRRPLDGALADYEQRRNEATLPDYRENLEAARLKPAAQQRGLLTALRDDPAATNHFFMASQGMVPPETFFNPENLQRLMAGAR